MQNIHTKQSNRGISLMEMVVVASVIGTVMLLMFGSMQNILQLSERSIERVQASMLLEEGGEIVRYLRDMNWTNISGLTNGTTYYPTWNGSVWSLSTTPSTVDNKYTRTVVFSAAYRDGNSQLASSGTLDTGTRKVTVTVTWVTADNQFSNTLTLYVSQLF